MDLAISFIELSRMGMGLVFLIGAFLDFKTRKAVFELMQLKKIPMPWLFYSGAIAWKAITSLGLIFNIYSFWSALLLAIYIFIANIIFNNFWAAPEEQRDLSFALFLIHLAVCFGLLALSGISGNSP